VLDVPEANSTVCCGFASLRLEHCFAFGRPIQLFVPGELAGSCFIGFAIGESLGAAALRAASGIFNKIADIGSDLMKIVFKIKEDDARNPGVIAPLRFPRATGGPGRYLPSLCSAAPNLSSCRGACRTCTISRD
jgi:hypothetical protein